MPIIIDLDVMMSRRKVKLKDLSKEVGISEANLSKLKNGRVKAIRLQTLERICLSLDCQPGDLLRFEVNEEE
ncbi:helix-turn-helix transcriptional regulator [bacterium]|nr:helix-turn-helix transcriptional regulator [bacterium]